MALIPAWVLPAGLPSSAQELACVHVDLLVAYFRVELALGVDELKGKAVTSTARLLATISKRDQQAAIFGSRTISEMKRDEAKVARKQQVRAQLGLMVPLYTAAWHCNTVAHSTMPSIEGTCGSMPVTHACPALLATLCEVSLASHHDMPTVPAGTCQ